MPQIYDLAPLDDDAQRITQRVIYAGGVLTLPSLFLALSGLLRYEAVYVAAIACCVLAAVVLSYIGWMWARQVRTIELSETQLVIKRRIGRTRAIPLSRIEAVNAAPLAIDAPPLRWGANAGVFGYAGEFVSHRYGRVHGMASHRECLVAISRTNEPLLLLSPANPTQFVDDVRTALSALEKKQP